MRTLLLLLLVVPVLAMAHNKSDVVTMYNGDRITGEIQGLTNGDLKINPRYSPAINLDLQHIAKIESDYNYEILTTDNQRLYGNISSTEKNGELQLTSIDNAQIVPLLGITEIRPVEESFADRLQYTLGANFTFEQRFQPFGFLFLRCVLQKHFHVARIRCRTIEYLRCHWATPHDFTKRGILQVG